jgi:hypothetical protein
MPTTDPILTREPAGLGWAFWIGLALTLGGAFCFGWVLALIVRGESGEFASWDIFLTYGGIFLYFLPPAFLIWVIVGGVLVRHEIKRLTNREQ